jgi:hypothetical protein
MLVMQEDPDSEHQGRFGHRNGCQLETTGQYDEDHEAANLPADKGSLHDQFCPKPAITNQLIEHGPFRNDSQHGVWELNLRAGSSQIPCGAILRRAKPAHSNARIRQRAPSRPWACCVWKASYFAWRLLPRRCGFVPARWK